MPVLLGDKPSRLTAIGLFILQYILVLIMVVSFTPVLLIVVFAFGALRIAVQVFRQPKPAQPPKEYPEDGWPLWFVAFAFLHNRRFGMLFILGLLIDAVLVASIL